MCVVEGELGKGREGYVTRCTGMSGYQIVGQERKKSQARAEQVQPQGIGCDCCQRLLEMHHHPAPPHYAARDCASREVLLWGSSGDNKPSATVNTRISEAQAC